jgi:hypothetical protein
MTRRSPTSLTKRKYKRKLAVGLFSPGTRLSLLPDTEIPAVRIDLIANNKVKGFSVVALAELDATVNELKKKLIKEKESCIISPSAQL